MFDWLTVAEGKVFDNDWLTVLDYKFNSSLEVMSSPEAV